jgi:hypothetical protein
MARAIFSVDQLRRQRNVASAAAVFFIVGSMALVLPRALHNRRMLKDTNDELIRLQREIGGTNTRIGDVQKKIGATQAEIGRLLNQK